MYKPESVQENETDIFLLNFERNLSPNPRQNTRLIAQTIGAVKCTDCIAAEGQYSPNECPGGGTYLCLTELFEIKLFDHLTVSKNCVLMLNWIV